MGNVNSPRPRRSREPLEKSSASGGPMQELASRSRFHQRESDFCLRRKRATTSHCLSLKRKTEGTFPRSSTNPDGNDNPSSLSFKFALLCYPTNGAGANENLQELPEEILNQNANGNVENPMIVAGNNENLQELQQEILNQNASGNDENPIIGPVAGADVPPEQNSPAAITEVIIHSLLWNMMVQQNIARLEEPPLALKQGVIMLAMWFILKFRF